METIFTNTESSETNESDKFVLNLSHRLDLRSSNKHVALQKLSISTCLLPTCLVQNLSTRGKT